MPLSKTKSYFVTQPSAVMREKPNAKSDPVNHLLFGDWLRYLGDENDSGPWRRVSCRGDKGWLKASEFSEDRVLEINFVDIGQGDSVHMVTPDDRAIIIDAGKTDNLYRFLQWRYNLRRRRVAGVDGVAKNDSKAKPPFAFEAAVISHPDEDHYYGFRNIFADRKMKFKTIYHNGIVERPISKADKDAVKGKKDIKYYSGDDLGRYVLEGGRNDPKFIWDVVHTDKEMRALIKKHSKTTKKYLSTMRAATENPANKGSKFRSLAVEDEYFPGYALDQDLTIKLLGPVTEERKYGGKKRDCLRRLGSEGVTKNGHSVIMKLKIGKLRVMLGGDLNTESEDFLFQQYCDTGEVASDLESTVYELKAKGSSIDEDEKKELHAAEASLNALVMKARQIFEVDITKACHHGSHHFSETFLQSLNAAATVISSGDQEKYSHPRPDALGAFGKYGRGHRPLIFSTEIARSTREFTPIFQYFERLKDYEARIANAATATEKTAIQNEMEEAKDSNVARYGMITVRTDGETVIIAQKLEMEDHPGRKWDIHELVYSEHNKTFEYRDKTKEAH